MCFLRSNNVTCQQHIVGYLNKQPLLSVFMDWFFEGRTWHESLRSFQAFVRPLLHACSLGLCVFFFSQSPPHSWMPLKCLISPKRLTTAFFSRSYMFCCIPLPQSSCFQEPIGLQHSLQLLPAMVSADAFGGLQPGVQTVPPFPPVLQIRQDRSSPAGIPREVRTMQMLPLFVFHYMGRNRNGKLPPDHAMPENGQDISKQKHPQILPY